MNLVTQMKITVYTVSLTSCLLMNYIIRKYTRKVDQHAGVLQRENTSECLGIEAMQGIQLGSILMVVYNVCEHDIHPLCCDT